MRSLALAVVGAAVVVTFFPSLQNGFVWDDDYNVLTNLPIRHLNHTSLQWMFTTTLGGPYQPLSWMSLALDYHIWGLNPMGYHVTNMVLHLFNAWLVCLICFALLRRFKPQDSHNHPVASWISAGAAALFFAVHPLRVESVAWVTERRDVLCGFFYLAALWSSLGVRRRSWFVASLFLCALLSKGMAVSFPFVLIMMDQILFGKPWRQSVKENYLFIVMSFVFAGIGLVGQTHASAMVSVLPPLARFELACYSPIFYLWKTICPWNLLPMYELPIPFPMGSPIFIGSVAMAIFITVLGTGLRKKYPGLLASWICYWLMLLPVAGIAQFGAQMAADRYSYLPSVPLALLFGGELLTILTKETRWIRRAAPVLLGGLFVGLILLTRKQVRTWRSEEILWTRAAAINPGMVRAQDGLGYLFLKRGDMERAVIHFQKAIVLNTHSWIAHAGLAQALSRMHHRDEAFREIGNAEVIDPEQGDIQEIYAELLSAEQRWNEALEHYQRWAELDPSHPAWAVGYAMAHNNLAVELAKSGHRDEALRHVREALRLDPQNALALKNLEILEPARKL